MGSEVVWVSLLALIGLLYLLENQRKMVMIAKGVSPDKLVSKNPGDHLLAGLVFTFLGLAIIISILIIPVNDLFLPGAIFVGIGLALLLHYKLVHDKKK
ncbi:hypothetical protein JW868_02300 [Candidatus Woesearchaeota archaeon]|nr:hypothetical protein [Candidatus Woesearchaeota archaeon]